MVGLIGGVDTSDMIVRNFNLHFFWNFYLHIPHLVYIMIKYINTFMEIEI